MAHYSKAPNNGTYPSSPARSMKTLFHLSTQVMQVPNVTHQEYQLASLDEDGVLVLEHGAEGAPKHVKLPPGKLGQQITSNFHMDKSIVVAVLGAMGGEQVVSQKVT
ncbi:hypothetical protein L198_01333 [Cryptococcus wingfieldii CBS 7118]|uniref:Translation initiation factor 5A C-terminal domain-containing protein n=1 Tax=Cryptococcus wingfieldii CBS 7118 TaxID=1295528 RepID=A0A1E3JZ69_9TREE|nr:hypothetical protein L198_01333 [Cryptococcus wingfieldii CBS 7118]ODO06101.1 hypothetical protein L198_01333 [Cryptococcus wingfieldii CBS 7118]